MGVNELGVLVRREEEAAERCRRIGIGLDMFMLLLLLLLLVARRVLLVVLLGVVVVVRVGESLETPVEVGGVVRRVVVWLVVWLVAVVVVGGRDTTVALFLFLPFLIFLLVLVLVDKGGGTLVLTVELGGEGSLGSSVALVDICKRSFLLLVSLIHVV
jgi:hypothetical protein